MRIVPPLADDPHRVSINRTTARSAAEAEQQHAAEPSAIRLAA
jgi:hypothetical protein